MAPLGFFNWLVPKFRVIAKILKITFLIKVWDFSWVFLKVDFVVLDFTEKAATGPLYAITYLVANVIWKLSL